MPTKIKDKATLDRSNNDATKCKWCHYSPFRRTVHLLDMIERDPGVSLKSHLLAEFPHQDASSGFFEAELCSVESVRHNWRNWRKWQANKMNSMARARIAEWLEA